MSHGVNKSFENVDRYYEMGANIAYYRRLAGFTQAQLAERVGVTRVHVSAIESSNTATACSIELLFRIAAALQVPPYKLLKSR